MEHHNDWQLPRHAGALRTWALAAGLSTCFTLVTPAMAGPMGFKGSTMVMGDFSPNWQETWVNYALTARDATTVPSLA